MTDPLVVCSVETGDLFRVFPSGRVTEIPREDDLREPKVLAALEERYARELSAEQGDTFRLVTFYPCKDCNGSGREVAAAYVRREWDDIHSYYEKFVSCAVHSGPPPLQNRWLRAVESHEHDCCECYGTGSLYNYTDEIVTRRELIEIARAA